MELLIKYGTTEQKNRWLRPLMNGEIRSCFAMTEPDVASSDALNIQTSILEYDSSNYIINGKKWFITGALHPNCKVCFLLGKTSKNKEDRYKNHSVIIIPINTKGLNILRPLTVFGYDDSPSGHAEIEFVNVVVPKENFA